MDRSFWQKQTFDAPLYPDMQWSRPENKVHAGKLLLIGGNVHSFAAVSEAFVAATRAGAGVVRMYLPDVLRKTLGKNFVAGEFGPSTPSGSFGQRALAEGLAMAYWADATLLAGDLGRNSETAIFLEKFTTKYSGQLTITKDAADYCITTPGACVDRPETTFVISLAQLQKLAIQSHFTTAFTYDMDILRFVDALHDFTEQHPVVIVVRHLHKVFVAYDGRISSTQVTSDENVWRVKTAAACATWWMQNPGKTFEAVSTAIVAD